MSTPRSPGEPDFDDLLFEAPPPRPHLEDLVPLGGPVGLPERPAGLEGALAPEALEAEADLILGLELERFRPLWAEPARTLWTPFLAGGLAHLAIIKPRMVSEPILQAAAKVLNAFDPAGQPPDLDSQTLWATCLLVTRGVPLARDHLPTGFVAACLGLAEPLPHARRLETVTAWLERVPPPPPAWAALLLAVDLPAARKQLDDFLKARPPYAGLAERFGEVAQAGSVTTWRDALGNALAFWRDHRGDALLRMLAQERMWHGIEAVARKLDAAMSPAGRSDGKPRLVAKLEAQLGRLREEIDHLKSAAAHAAREASELRQARDRAVARARAIEEEMEALRRRLPPSPPVPESEPATPEPPPVTLPVAAPEERLDEFFRDRLVYVYTGQQRTHARRDMQRTLERHGAICEVYDGNRPGELGPDRYPADAIVVIDTRFLSHSASERIADRARASGAWFYMGPTGQGGLARKVAERWFGSERGSG
jgi:hypothetical protein